MAKKRKIKPEAGFWEYRCLERSVHYQVLTGKKEAKVLRKAGGTIQRRHVLVRQWEDWK